MRQNQKGFTLAEMIVGVALMGIMGMVAASFFIFTTKVKNDITNEIEDKVDNIIAERMLLKDLKNSEPSFNNVVLPDDLGYNFFDLVIDVSDTAGDDKKREVTLDINRRKEIIFMTANERIGAVMYAPYLAFEVGPAPKDPNAAASLDFRSLNFNDVVTRATFPAGALWQPGIVLMMDSLGAVREMKASGPDYSKPARALSFVGVVQQLGASQLRPLDIPIFLNRTNPLYPNETISSEKDFLMNVPPLGGAAPLVRLKSVVIVKYYVDRDKNGDKINLYRSTYDGTKFSAGQLFASDITNVVFRRESARDALIYYVINRPSK